jgi:triosephosphate isomerase
MPDFCYMINFKHYFEATGNRARILLDGFSKIQKKGKLSLQVALSPLDLNLSSTVGNITFLAQHVDPVGYGAYTGKISMDALIERGIHGSLLNHSENRILPEQIIATVKRADDLGFNITLCLENINEIEKYVGIRPRYIAYEPKELIGGNISVSTAKPDVVENAARLCSEFDVDLLVGAGIKNSGDVKKSLELGAKGVLVASGVVKAEDPLGALNSLMSIQ